MFRSTAEASDAASASAGGERGGIPHRVADIAALAVLAPLGRQLVDLARDEPQLLAVESLRTASGTACACQGLSDRQCICRAAESAHFVDLAEAAATEEVLQDVSPAEHRGLRTNVAIEHPR